MYGLSPGLLSRGRVVAPAPPVIAPQAPSEPHTTAGQRATAAVAASSKRRSPRPLTQPLLYPVSDDDLRLALDYDYVWREEGKACKILIPKCFEHDGASVPRWLWSLSGITPVGLISAAALIHDILYMMKGHVVYFKYFESEPCCDIWVPAHRVFTRGEADGLFYRIMRESGLSFKAKKAYAGVRLWGWKTWRFN